MSASGGRKDAFAALRSRSRSRSRSTRKTRGRSRSRSRDDVIFQDKDICILKPDSKWGIPIYHISSNPAICRDKLYSYNGLRKAKPELGLRPLSSLTDSDHYNYIYFSPPDVKKTPGNTFQSYHGKTPEEIINRPEYRSMAIIKVDPDKTYVYFQLARSDGIAKDVTDSRMKLSKFMNYVNKGDQALEFSHVSDRFLKNIYHDLNIVNEFNYTSEINDDEIPETNQYWEVVAKTDFLERSEYVCLENNVPFVENSVQKLRTRGAAGAGAGAGGAAARTSILRNYVESDNYGAPYANRSGEAQIQTFKPIWIKRGEPFNDWTIKCPECGSQSGSLLIINHFAPCSLTGMKPDLSNKPKTGGTKRRTRRRN